MMACEPPRCRRVYYGRVRGKSAAEARLAHRIGIADSNTAPIEAAAARLELRLFAEPVPELTRRPAREGPESVQAAQFGK